MTAASSLDKRFVRHVAGMMALMEWQGLWARHSRGFHWQGAVLNLPTLASQRWGLGCPRHPGAARHPALLVQTQERRWLERIAWERTVFNQETGELALLAHPWHTPAGFWPGFAVVLLVSPIDKWQVLGATGHIEARALWWDGADKAHVATGRPIFRLPSQALPATDWKAAVGEYQKNGQVLHAASGDHDRIHRLLRPQGVDHVGSW